MLLHPEAMYNAMKIPRSRDFRLQDDTCNEYKKSEYEYYCYENNESFEYLFSFSRCIEEDGIHTERQGSENTKLF